MSITKKPSQQQDKPLKNLEKFIEGAPDGRKATQPKEEDDESVQITLRLSREQLDRIGAVAKRQGIPRASYIKRCVFVTLERDEYVREIGTK